ncbi:MAG: Phosphomannomutase/phosphoglucomutase [Fimbriimonadaceae bacterium]|nr:Phosphomannomutase/phosphoglucomutase [Fimbriimonadaceae bacterium]
MGQYLACFKAYDVRGIVPDELNPELAYDIGRAYADETGAQTVCVGYDIRLSGPSLALSLANGLADAGIKVVDLGLVGTEMVYFATAFYGYDGGIMITASHNPPQYNGMKMVRQESRPISSDTGLNLIEKRAFEKQFDRSAATQPPRQSHPSLYADYVKHLLTFVNPVELRPLRILANPGNGAAGIAVEAVAPYLPLQITRMHFDPDGSFPNGVPNPILESSRAEMEAKMREDGTYDFGVAWDGDYDRCFFLDGHGNFIEGYYIVGLLAQSILGVDPKQTIIYDPRLYWNTLDIANRLGGKAVVCKSGHAFIKEKMRAEDAVYGGEMSAHHYFRGHWYCDSGMIPLMLIAHLISQSGKSLGELVGEMISRFPCSGEINSVVASVPDVLARVEAAYPGGKIDRIDGLSIAYEDWRFNLRGSNTEPVIRLNVESRSNRDLMEQKTAELLELIRT